MTEGRDFDSVAAGWDQEPRRVKLAREVGEAIAIAVPLDRTMEVMDFGCGTGLVTLYLQQYVGSVTGVDTSSGMLAELERKVAALGVTNIRTQLLDPEGGGMPEGTYDLIVTSMTLHHVGDVPALLGMFRGLLRSGGRLCLADLDAEDGTFHDDPTGIMHNGFEREDLMRFLGEAGFTGMTATTAAVVRKSSPVRTRDYPVFLIRAELPA